LQLCADIGAVADTRLVLKGVTLLRLCYFEPYRYSADVDFSAIEDLSRASGTAIVASAAAVCRERFALPTGVDDRAVPNGS
jgi:predicted nucleotidyltransferase component of viral defense system